MSLLCAACSIGPTVFAKDVALDDAGLLCLADVGAATGEDGVAVISAPIASQEPDEPLPMPSVELRSRGFWGGRLTEKDAISFFRQELDRDSELVGLLVMAVVLGGAPCFGV